MMNHEHFARKIPAYFDGTLKESERTEFEAYVGSHPEFADYFRKKEVEQNSIKMRIPNTELDSVALEALESEVKEVIKNLFHEDDASLSKRVGNWFKERL